jgi:hypothetical protein
MNRQVWGVFIGVILMAFGLGVYLYIANNRADPVPTVEYIYKRYNPSTGLLNDFTNEIDFQGYDSLGYDQLDNEEVRIKFGTMLFTLNLQDLENEGLMQMLNKMGLEITVETSERGKNTFIVEYKGKQVEKYDLQVGS